MYNITAIIKYVNSKTEDNINTVLNIHHWYAEPNHTKPILSMVGYK